MRHRKRGRRLNRTPAHRKALLRALAIGLFKSEKNRIVTTVAKAKEARPFVEKLVTLARNKTLHRYRRALAILGDEGVVHHLFDQIAPRYVDRPGGYTRIIRWPKPRLGDNAPQAILELLPEEEADKPDKKRKRRRRLSLKRKPKEKKAAKAAEPEEAPVAETAEADPEAQEGD